MSTPGPRAALVAATALALSASLAVSAAASVSAEDTTAPGEGREYVVGVDTQPGWHWVLGSDGGCSVSSTGDDHWKSSASTYKKADLFLVPDDAETVVVDGCTTFAHVDTLRKKPLKRIRVQGAYLVGPHLKKRSVYVGKPRGTFGSCTWKRFGSFQAFDDHFGFPTGKGRLKVTGRTRVVLLSDDCVWRKKPSRR